MNQPSFLLQDSSWRTFVIPWGKNFNGNLSQHQTGRGSSISSSVELIEPDLYSAGNNNALGLLDFRHADKAGKLPKHVCASAFQIWMPLENEVITRINWRLNQTFSGAETGVENDLALSFLAGWLAILKFNLAMLSLVDVNSPPLLLQFVPGALAEVIPTVQGFAGHWESSLESSMGVPCPSRQVREAVQSVL